ncbi:putative transmembrane protein [Dioscorea sansibarensis]
MKQGFVAGIPFWGCLWRMLRVSCAVMLLVLLFSCSIGVAFSFRSEDEVGFEGGCVRYGGFGALDNGSEGSPGCLRMEYVCGDSDSFCFPSTLLVSEEDDRCEAQDAVGASSEVEGSKSEENIVSCAFVDSVSEVHEEVNSEKKNFDGDGVSSCKGSVFADAWMEGSTGLIGSFDEHSVSSSLSPHVEISPSSLDFGMKDRYSPSLELLTVRNLDNEIVLDVYDLFSTDPQFYPIGFDKLCLAPGEAASIGFVFLPRNLGSSSAHIVLQTSCGGFIIQAKGVAIESHYKAEAFVGLDINSGVKLNRNLSLHNPFDDLLYVQEVTAWISFYSGNVTNLRHVACNTDAYEWSPEDFGSSSSVKDFLTVKGSDEGFHWFEIKPHTQFKLSPHEDETIIELNMWPSMQGKISGAICMKLRASTLDKPDVIIVPLEAEVHGKVTYNALSGLASAYFESLAPCKEAGMVFTLYVRNSAPYVLSVVGISEVTECSELFRIKYMSGLIVYPGTVTQVALIGFTPPSNPDALPPGIPTVNPNCMLVIMTNDSANPEIKIPCQDLVSVCSRHEPKSSSVPSDGSYIGLGLHQDKDKLTNAKTGPLGSIVEDSLLKKSKHFELLEADELVLTNWRSHGTMSDLSVLKDDELLFPVVQIGTIFSKWIAVHNPSQKPVVMQILLNSGEIIDQCKSSDVTSKGMLSGFNLIDSTVTRYGFSVSNSAITEAFVHPFGSALFGPIVFHPSSRCMWRSSVLIRNNLSGVEWLPLRAYGGSHSLTLLEGSEPVDKLEFRLDLPMKRNLSSPDTAYHLDLKNASCNHILFKELYAKNTGELPLEVIKLQVSGADCVLDGFRIETCKGFNLAPGETRRLLVSYEADFTATEVQRDLKLAMATGFLVIPMKASLPVFMVNVCRKSWKFMSMPIIVMLVTVSVILLVLFILPHTFPSGIEDYLVKDNNVISTITCDGKRSRMHHFTGKARSVKENVKSEVGHVDRCSPCRNGVQGSNIKKMQAKKDLDHQKKPTLTQPSPTETHPRDSDTSESPQNGHLTVHVARERGRRRRRRGGLAAKFEVSSSQSGNSTPSSPLSPNASTPKEIWSSSRDSPETIFSRESVGRNENKEGLTEPEISIECYESNCLPSALNKSAPEKSHVTVKSNAKPTLLPSATFPSAGWRAPGVGTSTFLASTSPIAPHARAPGSNLSKEKMIKQVEDDVLGSEFTYDIWGNHFSGPLDGKPKRLLSRVSDASEGDSQSFFTTDPQLLMMLSTVHSESPGQKSPLSVSQGCKPPLNDVSCLNQMD